MSLPNIFSQDLVIKVANSIITRLVSIYLNFEYISNLIIVLILQAIYAFFHKICMEQLATINILSLLSKRSSGFLSCCSFLILVRKIYPESPQCTYYRLLDGKTQIPILKVLSPMNAYQDTLWKIQPR